MSDWTPEEIEIAREVVASNAWRVNSNTDNAMLLYLARIGLRVVDPSTEDVHRAAVAFCKSGPFETGHGTCAAICMGQLGDARKGSCAYASQVHRKLVTVALKAITEDGE